MQMWMDCKVLMLCNSSHRVFLLVASQKFDVEDQRILLTMQFISCFSSMFPLCTCGFFQIRWHKSKNTCWLQVASNVFLWCVLKVISVNSALLILFILCISTAWLIKKFLLLIVFLIFHSLLLKIQMQLGCMKRTLWKIFRLRYDTR